MINNIFDESYLKSNNDLLSESVFKDKKDLNNIKSEVKKGNFSILKSFKSVIEKIYRDSPETLASDLPSIGEIIRLVIVVGVPAMVNPLISIFTLIVDRLLKDKANEKVINKYISKYEKEIDKFQRKIDTCTDRKKKKDYEEALNSLQNGLNNLEEYRDKLEAPVSKIITESDEELEDAVNLMISQYSLLSEEQKIILYDDEFIISEGVIDNVKNGIKVVKHDVGKKIDAMDKWFQDTAKNIKYGIQNNKRNDIIENNFIPKLSKLIKRAIILGATWAINPAIATLGAVTAFILSKKGTATQRKRILKDINNELELVKEKIKDADSNNDKKEKYQLIRLRQKLENNRDKIKRFI